MDTTTTTNTEIIIVNIITEITTEITSRDSTSRVRSMELTSKEETNLLMDTLRASLPTTGERRACEWISRSTSRSRRELEMAITRLMVEDSSSIRQTSLECLNFSHPQLRTARLVGPSPSHLLWVWQQSSNPSQSPSTTQHLSAGTLFALLLIDLFVDSINWLPF